MTPPEHDSAGPGGHGPSRRDVLFAGAGALATAVLAAACGGGSDEPQTSAPTPTAPGAGAGTSTGPAADGSSSTLAPTPACGDDDDITLAQTEGPFFTPNSPERSDLRAGVSGVPLVLTGTVMTIACRPVARALLDVWQADGAGVYDNQGFRLRGHLFTDDQGRFRLATVMPGEYPGRTPHLHVKVRGPDHPLLTTQLYFPGQARNASDGIYRPELVVDLQDTAGGREATFTFVLA